MVISTPILHPKTDKQTLNIKLEEPQKVLLGSFTQFASFYIVHVYLLCLILMVELFQNKASLLLIVTSSADRTVLDESLSLPTPVVSGMSISPAHTVYVCLWCVDKNSCSLHPLTACEDELGVRGRSLVQSKHERPFKLFVSI